MMKIPIAMRAYIWGSAFVRGKCDYINPLCDYEQPDDVYFNC
jgi:hypothetical protein